jgi:hypothetical protein
MIVLSGLLHKYPLLLLLTKAKKSQQVSFRIVDNLEQFANSGLKLQEGNTTPVVSPITHH